jgi:hypothetical protein
MLYAGGCTSGGPSPDALLREHDGADVLPVVGSMVTAAGERSQHRQQGGGVGYGLEERRVGRFHGGDGLFG